MRKMSTKSEDAIRLLDAWLADESGYDEKWWPIIEKALKKEGILRKEMKLFVWHYIGYPCFEPYGEEGRYGVIAETLEEARNIFAAWYSETKPINDRDYKMFHPDKHPAQSVEWKVDVFGCGDMVFTGIFTLIV